MEEHGYVVVVTFCWYTLESSHSNVWETSTSFELQFDLVYAALNKEEVIILHVTERCVWTWDKY